MSSHLHLDYVSTRTADPGTAEVAVVRRADGRTLRKSCDRCHQQKLRCVGDKTSLTRCKRCKTAGLECVYGARSSKKASQCSIDNFATWDNWPGNSATPTLNEAVSELDTMFGLELTHFDEVFPMSPASRPDTGGSPSFVAPNLPALEHDSAGIPVSSAITMPLLTSGSSPVAGDGPITEFPELSAQLAQAFQELEATFLRTVEDQTSRRTQDYPIGEVLSALGSFLGVLKLSNVVGAGPLSRPCTSQTPQDAHLRSKQASIAAQGYVLCVRLLASLLEQMLQSLLASPSPSPTVSGSSASPDSAQDASGLGATGSNFSDACQVPHSLRLGDLLVPPDHFGHALSSSVNLLRIGCSRLNEMESLLGIPSKQRGQNTSSLVCLEQAGVAQQALPDNGSSGPSLPARFVASIWEDETSINNKSSVVHLQRCRAAILGLTEHCA
ncbi:hypothetical protein A1O3_00848 [Capronia epimyces CBS 606.96]|uniref:Zn(2)-C6 fungal-type domain-containing protein n=1 Tax=Capronia epimyces CBS 606.96 TaxID=1182542 RepID=W9YID3_9EURO|nr:uncharacterized protein A1O3_00848 [Capronia epimyces CBS 606.96]EXJ92298.1 hypothetical protein A1O3_00848 [Capronia epimyces CBS 606.96]